MENKCWASLICQFITHLFEDFPEQREENEKLQPKVKTLLAHLYVDFLSFISLSSFLHLHLH